MPGTVTWNGDGDSVVAEKAAPAEPVRMALPVGIHAGVPEETYHLDCADGVSASASILRVMFKESPEHVRHAHPKLNPEFVASKSTEAKDAGTILHSLVLRTPAPYRIVRFDDFKSKKAQMVRDIARADGLIPIIERKFDEHQEVASSLQQRLADEHPDIWTAINDQETLKEATLVFERDGVLCRCRTDLLPPKHYHFIADFKFTGLTAAPDEWVRKLRDDYAIQSAFYPMGVELLRGDDPEMLYIVCETKPPYGVSVHALDAMMQGIARNRMLRMLSRWKLCLEHNWWPGYPNIVYRADTPGWMESQEERTVARDAMIDRLMRAKIAPPAPTALDLITAREESPF